MAPPQTSDRGYRQIDHTGDIAIELWAPSEAELLVLGAEAITALLTDGVLVSAVDARSVELNGLDGEDRLVRWLNEIIYLAVTEGFLFGSGALELSGPGGLSGSIRGEANAVAKIRTELKSATYHQLVLRAEGARYFARVTIDV